MEQQRGLVAGAAVTAESDRVHQRERDFINESFGESEQALLDNFAMAALTGLLACPGDLMCSDLPYAAMAYDHAEACMAERKRRMEARQQA